MSDFWNSRYRVGDRLAELRQEAERDRRSHLGEKPTPRLADRLAVVLRATADRLDQGSGQPSPHRLTQG
jgi:hypothetical protein